MREVGIRLERYDRAKLRKVQQLGLGFVENG